MKTVTKLTGAFAIIAASAAYAQGAEETTDAAKAETEASSTELDEDAEDPGKKKRCKQVRNVNTRIPTRVCMTVDEWEQLTRETQEERARIRNRSSSCSGSGSC